MRFNEKRFFWVFLKIDMTHITWRKVNYGIYCGFIIMVIIKKVSKPIVLLNQIVGL